MAARVVNKPACGGALYEAAVSMTTDPDTQMLLRKIGKTNIDSASKPGPVGSHGQSLLPNQTLDLSPTLFKTLSLR